MQIATETEKTFIATTCAHVAQVRVFTHYKSTEAELRAATGSLRFLLADGNLARAWRASNIKGPMTFTTSCIKSTNIGPVVAMCGGGDLLPNISFSACRGAVLETKTLDLHAFCSATRIQVDTTKISTVELIQYVANALGGSHFDPLGKASKKPRAEILAKLDRGEIQGVPLRVNDRNLLHHEILSIAQAVIRSPQVGALEKWSKFHAKNTHGSGSQ